MLSPRDEQSFLREQKGGVIVSYRSFKCVAVIGFAVALVNEHSLWELSVLDSEGHRLLQSVRAEDDTVDDAGDEALREDGRIEFGGRADEMDSDSGGLFAELQQQCFRLLRSNRHQVLQRIENQDNARTRAGNGSQKSTFARIGKAYQT